MMTPMCSRTAQLRFCCQTKINHTSISRGRHFSWTILTPFAEDFSNTRLGSMSSAVINFKSKQLENASVFYSFNPSTLTHQNLNHRTLFCLLPARYLNTILYTPYSPFCSLNNFVSHRSHSSPINKPVEPLLKIDFLNKTQNHEWSRVDCTQRNDH